MACYLVYVIGPDRRDDALVGMTTSIGNLQRSFSSYPRQFPAECSFPVTRTLQSFALGGAGGYLSQYALSTIYLYVGPTQTIPGWGCLSVVGHRPHITLS